MTITASTEISPDDTRATRLAILQAQVVDARADLQVAALCGDTSLALETVECLATLLQHTLQELAHLACETSPAEPVVPDLTRAGTTGVHRALPLPPTPCPGAADRATGQRCC